MKMPETESILIDWYLSIFYIKASRFEDPIIPYTHDYLNSTLSTADIKIYSMECSRNKCSALDEC